MPQPDLAWMEYAACEGMERRTFFPTTVDTAKAKRTCAACEVRRDCLEYALATEVPDGRAGIWGGLTAKQREQEFDRRAQVRRRPGMVSQ